MPDSDIGAYIDVVRRQAVNDDRGIRWRLRSAALACLGLEILFLGRILRDRAAKQPPASSVSSVKHGQ
jgi:hypothetical protein